MANLDLIRALETALEAAPDNPALRRHLADLCLADGLYAQAVPHYRRLLDQAPTDAALKFALAQAYEGQGKADVALVVLEDILRSAQGKTQALAKTLRMAARLYFASGQTADAVRSYQQAVQADPSLADDGFASQLGLAGQSETESRQRAFSDPPEADAHGAAEEEETEQPGKELVFVVGKDEPDPATLYEVERPKISFADVGGMETLKEAVRMKIIYPMAHPELFRAYGKPIGGGILMYGPPGCGKTHLARATAGEVHAAFLSIGLHDVLDMYIGQSERNLHQVFEIARKKAPCVLFFDEVDALGANRADMRHNAMRQVINQLLSEMDGVDASNEGVLILAATNTPWYVDPALRRPGRFDRVLFVPPPDEVARESILRLLLQGKPAHALDTLRIARETKDFSGADLKGLVDLAVEQKLAEAMRRGAPAPLTTGDLQAAVRKQRPTTLEWFETARNYAVYSNEGGFYDDILTYLKLPRTKL